MERPNPPSAPVPNLRVVICDDHRAFREALADYLRRRGITSIELAGDADSAVRLVRAGADVLVLDLLLKGEASSLDALEALTNHGIAVRVLLISGEADLDLIARAIALGATGFCPKQASPEEFMSFLLRVAAGEVAVPASIVSPVAHRLATIRREHRERTAMLDRLSERELEVLQLLVRGSRRDQIARRLHMSPNTVRTHLRSILLKLNVHSQVAAAAAGRRLFANAEAPDVIRIPDVEGDAGGTDINDITADSATPRQRPSPPEG